VARLFNDAASDYAGLTQAVVNRPFVYGCWVYTDTVALTQCAMSLGNSATATPYFALHCDGAAAGDPVTWYQRDDAAGTAFTNTTSGFVANTWHHICAIEAATDSRSVFIDGGGKGTNATARGALTLNRTGIGCLLRTGTVFHFSGRIAWPAFWDLSVWPGATGPDKAAAFEAAALPGLAAGIPPWKFPLGLVACWPLWGYHSPEIDLMGAYDLTLSGTTRAEGPPVSPMWMMRRSGLFVPAAWLDREYPRGVGRGLMRGVA